MSYDNYRIIFSDSAPVIVNAYSRESAIDRAIASTRFPYRKSHLSRTQKKKSIVSAKKVK